MHSRAGSQLPALSRGALCLAGALLAAAPALIQAQVLPRAADPGAAQQRQIEEERRLREQERESRTPAKDPLRLDVPEAPAAAPGAEAVRFVLQEIRFTPSEILSADDLEALAREYRGREISLADLQQLASRINELYRSRGVVTAQAVIPPQDISKGIVIIRLVEGRLGQTRIEGNTTTNESYVTARLPLKTGDLIDLVRLEQALIRFNRTNDVQVTAQLKPGEQFATTDLLVVMTEPPRQELRLFSDNFGVESTGDLRVGAWYLNRSVLGFRDDLSVFVTHAEGQDSYSGTYGFPFNPWGGRISLGYFVDKTEIKNGVLASLNITGKSEARVLSVRQPTFVGPSAQLDVVLGARDSDISNKIDGVPLTQLDTKDGSIGLEGQIFESRANWFASYVYTSGHAETPERDDFQINRGALRHNRDFGGGLSFRGNLAWQQSNDLLPANQQFFIGGEGSVRGYPTGLLSGDTGYVLNLELHHPLVAAAVGSAPLAVTGFLFVDHGEVKPFRAAGSLLPEKEHLTGGGGGVHISVGKHVYGRLTYGYGFTEVPTLARQYEVTFQLVASLF